MKNMKTKMMAAIAAMLMTSGAIAQSDQHGNGGGAVVCRDSVGKISSAKLVDIYEGESDMLQMLFDRKKNTAELLIWAMARLKGYQKDYGTLVESETSKMMKSITEYDRYVYLSREPLERVNDVYNITFPKGCAIEQAAIRLSDEQRSAMKGIKYVFSREIWESLDDLNRAALLIHESVYLISGKSNSTLSRAVVREILNTMSNFAHITLAIFNDGYRNVIPAIAGSPNHQAHHAFIAGPGIYLQTSPFDVILQLAYDFEGRFVPDRVMQHSHQLMIHVDRKYFAKGFRFSANISGGRDFELKINRDLWNSSIATHVLLIPYIRWDDELQIIINNPNQNWFIAKLNHRYSAAHETLLRNFNGQLIDLLLPGIKK